MPLITPKLDWIANPVNPTSEDMNRIESNIDFLNTDIETKKGAIVDALVDVGISTLITDTHAAIASKIIAAEKTGISILPSTVNQVIPKGIFNTDGGLVLGDADLVVANIKLGKDIFGVVGTVEDASEFILFTPNKNKHLAWTPGLWVQGNDYQPERTATTGGLKILNWWECYYVTNQPVDLTGKNFLVVSGVEFDTSGTYHAVYAAVTVSKYVGLYAAGYMSSNGVRAISPSNSSTSKVRLTAVLDISALNGLYYINAGAEGGNPGFGCTIDFVALG